MRTHPTSSPLAGLILFAFAALVLITGPSFAVAQQPDDDDPASASGDTGTGAFGAEADADGGDDGADADAGDDAGDPGDPASQAMFDEVTGLDRLGEFADRPIRAVRFEAIRYNGKAELIRDIAGYANFVHSPRWLRRRVLTTSGQRLRVARVRDDLRRLQNSGLFNLMRVLVDDAGSDGPVTLVYRMRSKPVTQIVFSPASLGTEGTASLKSDLSVKEGVEYRESAGQQDVTTLTERKNKHNLHYVAVRVEIDRLPDGSFADGLTVTYLFQENRRVIGVDFTGLDQGPGEDDLRKLLDTARTGFTNPDSVARDAQRIVEEYRGKGFYFCEVNWRVDERYLDGTPVDPARRDPERRTRNTLIFEVIEGPKVKVGAIEFHGMHLLVPAKGDTIFDMPDEWWDLGYAFALWVSNEEARGDIFRQTLTGNGDFKPANIARDILLLQELLRGNGWLDARVLLKAVNFGEDRSRVTLVYDFLPGVLYKIRSVTVRGEFNAFSRDDVRQRMTIREGDTYRRLQVEGDATRKLRKKPGDQLVIQRLFQDRGYFNCRVDVEETTVAPNLVDIVYTVHQGNRVRIGQVKIRGNETTKESVIRRYLASRPGDWYSATRVETDHLRLLRNQWFARDAQGVRITPSPSGDPYDSEQYVDLNVDVVEGETGSFNLGVGWSSQNGLVGFFNLTKRNFDIGDWPSFTGGGQELSLSAQPGPQSQTYRIQFTEPFFFNSRFGFATSFSYINEALPDWDQLNWLFTASFSYRLISDLIARLQYKWNWAKAFNVSDDAPPVIQEARTSRVYSSLRFSLEFDQRDDIFFATQGFNVEAGFELGGEYLAGNVNWWHFNVLGSLNFPFPIPLLRSVIGEQTAISIRAAFDWQEPWNGDASIPIIRRVALGGAALPGQPAMRGFAREGVGPRDSNGFALRGTARLAANIELRYPLQPGIIYLVLFFDIGQLQPEIGDLAINHWNMSWGFGLRLKLPISPAPLALDFGFPIKSFSGDEEQTVSFSLGFNF